MHPLGPTPTPATPRPHPGAGLFWLHRIALVLLALVLAFALTSLAQSQTRGVNAQGRPFVSGGVGFEALQALHARRDAYSFWVVTAAKRSGAYLADVRIKINDAENRLVFDSALDGPWLFIDLALGRYSVEASFQGQTQRAVTTIHPGDHHQVLFYFDAPGEVDPDRDSPFNRNPFGK